MTTTGRRTTRRTDALSRERIVDAAIDILDTEGERGLTVRALAARLATGSGAIYWHIGDKDGLLAAVTADVVGRAVTGVAGSVTPREALFAIASEVFDVIAAHPWIGAQLAREPWQPAMLRIFDSLGEQIRALGVPPESQFNVATALLNHVLGLACQYAAGARLVLQHGDPSTFLGEQAARWEQLNPSEYPFVTDIASQLPGHDDRAQFIAGIDLILAGVTAQRQAP
ncbi:TetR family transcriptional regulator [Amycolatopsis orientalis]|uniref:TetR family transcriptional regulator n=1 Tax=Amycolatopsis orientalis TaxID=31958 RepID=A0A193BUV0_AMYOR|nr:TetR/AcrR family transcriptional regulator [Amycolatopsis orientalis]ANN15958.1 TetR family transcriptional regulator [Amycolatopsis orientalis]